MRRRASEVAGACTMPARAPRQQSAKTVSTHSTPRFHLGCLLDLRRALLPVRALVGLAAEGVKAVAAPAAAAAAAVLGLWEILAPTYNTRLDTESSQNIPQCRQVVQLPKAVLKQAGAQRTQGL